MIPHEGIKEGDKLIFVQYGGVLSAQKGNVFTFSNWHNKQGKYWDTWKFWQCKELHDVGNHEHNFSLREVEVFDPEIHKEFRMMNVTELNRDYVEAVEKYGE